SPFLLCLTFARIFAPDLLSVVLLAPHQPPVTLACPLAALRARVTLLAAPLHQTSRGLPREVARDSAFSSGLCCSDRFLRCHWRSFGAAERRRLLQRQNRHLYRLRWGGRWL